MSHPVPASLCLSGLRPGEICMRGSASWLGQGLLVTAAEHGQLQCRYAKPAGCKHLLLSSPSKSFPKPYIIESRWAVKSPEPLNPR